MKRTLSSIKGIYQLGHEHFSTKNELSNFLAIANNQLAPIYSKFKHGRSLLQYVVHVVRNNSLRACIDNWTFSLHGKKSVQGIIPCTVHILYMKGMQTTWTWGCTRLMEPRIKSTGVYPLPPSSCLAPTSTNCSFQLALYNVETLAHHGYAFNLVQQKCLH